MANTVISPGFTGILDSDGLKVRTTSFSLNTTQDSQFFNHVIGLNDTIPATSATKGEALGTRNIQRYIWRPSVISLGGSLSFPATENSIKSFFDRAKDGDFIPELNYQYYCSQASDYNGIKFKQCRINGYDFSIQAGDILNIGVDIVAMDAEPEKTVTVETSRFSEKLITWDMVNVSVVSATVPIIKGFSMKINNNIQTIYARGADADQSNYKSLLPSYLRVGMQEVTGTVSVYMSQGQRFMPLNEQTPAIINFSAPGLGAIKMQVVFFTSQLEGITGPVICELPYTGIHKTFVD